MRRASLTLVGQLAQLADQLAAVVVFQQALQQAGGVVGLLQLGVLLRHRQRQAGVLPLLRRNALPPLAQLLAVDQLRRWSR